MSSKGRIYKKFFIRFAWVFVWATLLTFGANAQESSRKLVLEFKGLVGTEGILQIALFQGESDYMQEEKAKLYRQRVSTLEKGRVKIPNLAEGVYAIAVFQDLDENGQLNKNLLGIPTEPYGFSGEKGGKWGVPRFEQASFEIRSGCNFQIIRLHQF